MAAITSQFRSYWRDLRRGKPGRRFQARYEQSRRGGNQQGKLMRILLISAAVVCLLIGVFLAVVPGPAIPFFILGGGLLAAESRPVAKFMDWCEVRCRKLAAWAKRIWDRLPVAVRVVLIVCSACCSAAVAFFLYRFMRD